MIRLRCNSCFDYEYVYAPSGDFVGAVRDVGGGVVYVYPAGWITYGFESFESSGQVDIRKVRVRIRAGNGLADGYVRVCAGGECVDSAYFSFGYGFEDISLELVEKPGGGAWDLESLNQIQVTFFNFDLSHDYIELDAVWVEVEYRLVESEVVYDKINFVGLVLDAGVLAYSVQNFYGDVFLRGLSDMVLGSFSGFAGGLVDVGVSAYDFSFLGDLYAVVFGAMQVLIAVSQIISLYDLNLAGFSLDSFIADSLVYHLFYQILVFDFVVENVLVFDLWLDGFNFVGFVGDLNVSVLNAGYVGLIASVLVLFNFILELFDLGQLTYYLFNQFLVLDFVVQNVLVADLWPAGFNFTTFTGDLYVSILNAGYISLYSNTLVLFNFVLDLLNFNQFVYYLFSQISVFGLVVGNVLFWDLWVTGFGFVGFESDLYVLGLDVGYIGLFTDVFVLFSFVSSLFDLNQLVYYLPYRVLVFGFGIQNVLLSDLWFAYFSFINFLGDLNVLVSVAGYVGLFINFSALFNFVFGLLDLWQLSYGLLYQVLTVDLFGNLYFGISAGGYISLLSNVWASFNFIVGLFDLSRLVYYLLYQVLMFDFGVQNVLLLDLGRLSYGYSFAYAGLEMVQLEWQALEVLSGVLYLMVYRFIFSEVLGLVVGVVELVYSELNLTFNVFLVNFVLLKLKFDVLFYVLIGVYVEDLVLGLVLGLVGSVSVDKSVQMFARFQDSFSLLYNSFTLNVLLSSIIVLVVGVAVGLGVMYSFVGVGGLFEVIRYCYGYVDVSYLWDVVFIYSKPFVEEFVMLSGYLFLVLLVCVGAYVFDFVVKRLGKVDIVGVVDFVRVFEWFARYFKARYRRLDDDLLRLYSELVGESVFSVQSDYVFSVQPAYVFSVKEESKFSE